MLKICKFSHASLSLCMLQEKVFPFFFFFDAQSTVYSDGAARTQMLLDRSCRCQQPQHSPHTPAPWEAMSEKCFISQSTSPCVVCNLSICSYLRVYQVEWALLSKLPPLLVTFPMVKGRRNVFLEGFPLSITMSIIIYNTSGIFSFRTARWLERVS